MKKERKLKKRKKKGNSNVYTTFLFSHYLKRKNGCIQWLKRLTNYSTDNLGRKDRSWPTFRVDSSVVLFRFVTNVTMRYCICE